jgi:hypothetical protein
MLTEAGTNRVQSDIPKNLLEVLFALDWTRAKSTLEEMPIKGVPFVELSRVYPVQVVHSLGERLGRRLDHEVKMVGHEAMGQRLPALAPGHATEQPEEQFAI